MGALRVEDLHPEEEAHVEERGLPAQPRIVRHPEEESTSGRAMQQTRAAPAPLVETFRQLPLLSALLAELTQLTSQHQQLPLSVHPNLAWLYRPTAERSHGVTPDVRPRSRPHSTRASPTPRGKRSPSPRLKQDKSLANSAASLSPSPKEVGKAKRQNPKQETAPPRSPPKRKLMYGLTHTVRLRMQQTNPGVLKEHERREQHRRKQMELLKRMKKRPLSLARTKSGQKLNGTSRGEVLNSHVSLDENIKTLVNSTEVGSPRIGNPPPQARSERESGSQAGKSCDSDIYLPAGATYDRVSRSVQKRTPAICPKNRDVRVHIPSALSQYSDHGDDDGAQSDASYTRPQMTNPGFQSTSEEGGRSLENSRFSSPARAYSDSHRDSFEPVEYLDDFTSPEPTDGHSPDFQSSPEPALGGSKKGASGSDSASQRSQRAALPVPVKAGASPQRSLKGTHIIRPRREASAISMSSGESEFASASGGSIRSRYHRRHGAASGGAERPSVSKDMEGSGSQLSDHFEDSPSARGSPVDSHLPANNSEAESISSPVPELEDEKRDELGSLGFDNKYCHISELVVNKLPGYTL
ncbi:microtubule-associated protein 10 [Megalops cyprinoides]|uniref:microtubule-associated protein 10 n=1 Tax=Megalops cyprinoides TaxID=118141 RepID=UPI00186413AF|nr:microtubule-associated protein 10 [Megalops cyprinoides]